LHLLILTMKSCHYDKTFLIAEYTEVMSLWQDFPNSKYWSRAIMARLSLLWSRPIMARLWFVEVVSLKHDFDYSRN